MTTSSNISDHEPGDDVPCFAVIAEKSTLAVLAATGGDAVPAADDRPDWWRYLFSGRPYHGASAIITNIQGALDAAQVYRERTWKHRGMTICC
jgi:hypothetical protein